MARRQAPGKIVGDCVTTFVIGSILLCLVALPLLRVALRVLAACSNFIEQIARKLV